MNQIQPIINNFAARGIELRVQYCNEDGKQIPRVQATGTGVLLSKDWELLRRNKSGIVKYLEQNGLVDQPFGEFLQDDFRFKKTEKILITPEMRDARITNSDERAAQSKTEAKNLPTEVLKQKKKQPHLKAEAPVKPRFGKRHPSSWNEAQEQLLCEIYNDPQRWPGRDLERSKQKKINDARRETIVEELAEHGPKRRWATVESYVSALRKRGVITTRHQAIR